MLTRTALQAPDICEEIFADSCTVAWAGMLI